MTRPLGSSERVLDERSRQRPGAGLPHPYAAVPARGGQVPASGREGHVEYIEGVAAKYQQAGHDLVGFNTDTIGFTANRKAVAAAKTEQVNNSEPSKLKLNSFASCNCQYAVNVVHTE